MRIFHPKDNICTKSTIIWLPNIMQPFMYERHVPRPPPPMTSEMIHCIWKGFHKVNMKFVLREIRREYKWCDKRNAYKHHSFYVFNHRDLSQAANVYIKRITTTTERKQLLNSIRALQILINQPNYIQTPPRYKYSSGKTTLQDIRLNSFLEYLS